MYEIFGKEEVVSVRKNPKNKQIGLSAPLKGDLNLTKRSIGLGSSKKVLGDVSKNALQPAATSHIRSVSPSKSIKILFPEENNVREELKKMCIVQSAKRSKSPINITPVSLKSNNGLAKCLIQSIKRSKSPINKTPISLKSNCGVANIPIYVENDSETEFETEREMLSDQEENVCVTAGVYGSLTYGPSDFAESPQNIYGYCSGYETPEDDVDGWLTEPLWKNKKDLSRMISLDQSLESVKELSVHEELSVQNNPLDENLFVDDPCIMLLPCNVPIPDLEW